MTRAETLAGLAEAIAGHEDYYWNRETHTTHCDCGHKHGEGLMVTGVAAIHRAHVAAVALSWLEGHGWAEGDVQDVHLPRIPHSTRTLRGVTTPVDTGDAP